MLQLGESCKYDDMCQSNKCLESLCVGEESKPFPWLIVGTVLAFLLLVIALITMVTLYVKNKQTKYLSNRRF